MSLNDLSVCACACLSVSLCVRARVRLSLCVCVRVSVRLSVCACACLSVSLCVRARVCLSLCVCVRVSVCLSADPAVREGRSDDGVDQQACSDPAERGEVQEVDPSPSTELLRHHHVHRAAAAETVCRLQVRELH